MQITESLIKEDSDYRINPNMQSNSGANDSTSMLKPPQFNRLDEIVLSSETVDASVGDGNKTRETSNTLLPVFTSPPPVSQSAPRTVPSKTNIRGNSKSI